MTSEKKRIKILCLHGYRQNVDIFRQKTGGVRRILKNLAQFEFVDAPHVVPICDGLSSEEENDCPDDSSSTYGWWLFIKNEVTGSIRCEGLEKSVEHFERTFQEKGPFDGLLAFSQGATFAAILSIFQQDKKLNTDFKFVIIIAGAHSLWEPLSKYSERIINLPSLHIIGETDQVIPRARSEALLKCFPDARYHTHPGGHYIPANASLKHVYCDFIEKQLNI